MTDPAEYAELLGVVPAGLIYDRLPPLKQGVSSMSDTTPIDLSGELTERLNTASPSKVTVLTYVDSGGQPHISVRGSVVAHGRDQLAFWVREGYVGTMTPGAQVGAGSQMPNPTPPPSGVLQGIEKNPLIAILYRDGRSTYVFSGRARIEDDEAARDAIFSAIPQGEQNHSMATGQRTGTAVVIDLDSVIGGSLGDGGVIASHVEMLRN
jgi:hypothetical protein